MKILIIEYATALGIDDPSICAEGHAMVNGLLDDLKDRKVDYLIRAGHKLDNNHCNPVELNEDLIGWLDKNILNYDACLVIAPEENFILHNISKFIEDNGVYVIGSSSKAVMECSDKFKMYEVLKDKVPIIGTEKIFFDDIDKFNDFNKKKVIKPADGVSCSGVMIINNLEELKKAASIIETNLPYFIIQDFVEGTTASVSLISNGKEAVPLSLNFQDIQFLEEGINYNGGQTPLDHKLSNEAKVAAKKAVESIDGLKGYVGVDMILGDEVHVVEINSRITTPYIALKDILNFNLAEAIIDSIWGKLPSEIKLNGKMAFYKENDALKIEKIN